MEESKKPVPENFFLPETRCGYYVSEKMKKVWAVELDLLKAFSEVCEKNNLKYFLNGGTLLGAVRHQGFIPWDDDVDVIMPREDYDRLWEIAEDEFQYPYFFQTALTEENFGRTHAQLRNSNTTGFIEIDRNKNINKGIFLDIFVLDNIPSDIKERKRLQRKTKLYKNIIYFQCDAQYSKLSVMRKAVHKLIHLFFKIYPFKRFFIHFNSKILGKYSNINTEEVGDITLLWRENVIWQRKWYEEFIYFKFENLLLRVPKNYDEILTKQYGNYMKIPEDVTEMNGRSHGEVTFNPDLPYNEFFKQQEDL